MTREELKKHCLKQVEDCEMWARFKREEPHGKIYEEHKLILELLEQEPCEDAISRQAVLKIQANYAEHIGATKFWQMRDDIRALPSVTPQQETGKWINQGDYAECSNCGANSGVQYNGVEPVPFNTRYCHNCGAKMTESDGENDEL